MRLKIKIFQSVQLELHMTHAIQTMYLTRYSIGTSTGIEVQMKSSAVDVWIFNRITHYDRAN